MSVVQQQLEDALMGLVAPGNEDAAKAVVEPGLEALSSGAMTADDIDEAVKAMTPLVAEDKVEALDQIAAACKRGLDLIPADPGLYCVLMSLVAPGNEEAAEEIVVPGLEALATGAMTADDVDEAVKAMTPLVAEDKVEELEKIAADVKAGL